MPKFSEVVELIRADCEVQKTELLASAWNVGEVALHEQRGPRDIVWVSDGGTFALPNPGSGAGAVGDGSYETSAMLMNRVVNFRCYVWGVDQDEAESMLEAVARSLDRALSWKNFTLVSYDAVNEIAEEAGYSWFGYSYMITGTMRLILPRETVPTVTITETPFDGEYAA